MNEVSRPEVSDVEERFISSVIDYINAKKEEGSSSVDVLIKWLKLCPRFDEISDVVNSAASRVLGVDSIDDFVKKLREIEKNEANKFRKEGRMYEQTRNQMKANAISRINNKYVSIDDYEMFGLKGKMVKISLPYKDKNKVQEHGYTFRLFVSDAEFSGQDIRKHPEYKENLKEMGDIVGALDAIKRYMTEHGVLIDEDIDYYEDLGPEGKRWESEAGNILKSILERMGINEEKFLLKDNIIFDCTEDGCHFELGDEEGYNSRLFVTPLIEHD